MTKHRFNMQQYMLAVSSAINAYRRWRYGQILFNVLHDGWPEIADEVRGGNFDPFYANAGDVLIDDFFRWLEENTEQV